MELSALFGFFSGMPLGDILVWAIASVVGVVALVAMVNALDTFLEAEAG